MESLELIISVLIGVAYLTLAERKVLGGIQRRKGPELVGAYGLLQAISDGIKLILKEVILPKESKKYIFIGAPILSLLLSLIIWGVIPIKRGIVLEDEQLGLLLILAISSISIYSTLYTGWSSVSKYGYLGAIRGIIQLISYEVSLGIILMSIIIINRKMNLNNIIEDQIYISNIYGFLPIFIFWLISILAETNRHPFDLVEAESELVAGNIVEYGGFAFGGIYLAEYSFILLMSNLTSILFYHGSLFFTLFCATLFIWIRAILPRFRYDQLILLGWTKILPLSLSFFSFYLALFL